MRYNGSSAASWDFTGGENQEAGEVLVPLPPNSLYTPYTWLMHADLTSLPFNIVWHTPSPPAWHSDAFTSISDSTKTWSYCSSWSHCLSDTHYFLSSLLTLPSSFLPAWHSLLPSYLFSSSFSLTLFLLPDTLAVCLTLWWWRLWH